MTLAHDENHDRDRDELSGMTTATAEVHDNPLAVAHDAMSYLALAAERVSKLLIAIPESHLRTELATIAQGIRSAYTVLDESAAIDVPLPPPADVATAIRRTLRLLRPWLLSNRVSSFGVEDAHRIAMSQGNLQRLLHILLLNAREEVGAEGTLLLTVARRSTIPGSRGQPDADVECVQISVGDEGGGIRSSHVARAFWTSTSRASDAPVEGLSIAFSIVRAARGTMRFETRRRRGTVVHCYLPVAHSA